MSSWCSPLLCRFRTVGTVRQLYEISKNIALIFLLFYKEKAIYTKNAAEEYKSREASPVGHEGRETTHAPAR
jgi:hypothetical protein